jgi:putative phosphoesterase
VIVGLIGDVHGNADALCAVLRAARRACVEQILCTGDLVGYYDQPSLVLALLDSWAVSHVRGNHERMLALARAIPDRCAHFEKSYGSGLRVALETLGTKALDWLEGLPDRQDLELDGRRILLCHGAPWDPDHYIYPDSDAHVWERCEQSGADMIVCGHTHYPLSRQCGRSLLVNPGSVGQPRNRVPGAHWAILDTGRMRVEHHVESYDASAVASRASIANPSLPYLSEVLLRS